MKKLNFLLLLPFLLQSAAAEERTDGWQFQLTPYLWLPTISGKLNYDLPPSDGGGGGAPDFDVGPTDWLDLLNGVLLLQGEARKNRFFLFIPILCTWVSNRTMTGSYRYLPEQVPLYLST